MQGIVKFFALFGISVSCTRWDATIVKDFDNLASNVYYAEQERAAARARQAVHD
jgi:hypothetical protein